MSLMPSERICLKRTRDQLVRQMDVTGVLPRLVGLRMFSPEEQAHIMADSRRRERVVMFLDMLEKKNSATFKEFSNALGEHDPHLYLVLSEWDKDDDRYRMHDSSNPSASRHGNMKRDDEWDHVNRSRAFLLTEIDGAEMIPLLDAAGLLSDEQRRTIIEDPVRERRSQSLLDLLETKHDGKAFKAFMDAIGELYPHVYLELTGEGGDDDDGSLVCKVASGRMNRRQNNETVDDDILLSRPSSQKPSKPSTIGNH